MKRIFAALGVAALAAILGFVATSPTTQAEAEWRGTHQRTVNLDGHVKTVSIPYVCRTLKYPDGANMLAACSEYGDLAGPTWFSAWHHMWNIPYSQGGHSDNMWFCSFGDEFCSDVASDGGSESTTTNYTMNDANTYWMQFRIDYPVGGGNDYCRRVFFNNTGSTSATTC